MSKPFQELDLCNSFLFAAAMEDSKVCQLMLQIILGHSVPDVVVHTEHSIVLNSDFKSVRLDVYAKDGLQVNYDLEAQNQDRKNLPKRSRFYQAEMDVSSLKPGENYNNLEPSYVIFICTFDPFEKGLYRYTFEERCLECDMALGDGTRKIFLNTKGTNPEDVSGELINFLGYMEKSTDAYVADVPEESIHQIHKKVQELKRWRRLEERYMTFEELINDRERKSRSEGIEKGIVEGKIEDILDLLTDLGDVPIAVEERIKKETDLEKLKSWLKLAAKAENVEEFMSKM